MSQPFGNDAYSTLTMLYSASFMMSWGPICWLLIAEIFPNTIRGKDLEDMSRMWREKMK